jgi:hypothetical protein
MCERRGKHCIGWGALIAIGCSLLICACASSSEPHTGAAGGPLLRLAQCMRAHGVSRFPDPSSTGEGLIIPNDIDTNAPAFKSAQGDCAKLAHSGGDQPRLSASRKAQFLAIAKCMRFHGVPDFADPTSSPPPPRIGGTAIGGNGWYLALGTAQERASPSYERAASACGARAL